MITKNMPAAAAALVGALVALTPCLAMPRFHSTKVYTVESEAGRLLKDVEERAYELHDHALTLQAATASGLAHDFYIGQATAMKEDVNSMGKLIARLKALESYETSDDKNVVERAQPMLAGIAKSANEFIVYLNSHPHQEITPEYKELTSALTGQTTSLWNLLHESVRLDNLKAREQHLEKDIAKLQSNKT